MAHRRLRKQTCPQTKAVEKILRQAPTITTDSRREDRKETPYSAPQTNKGMRNICASINNK